MERWVLIRVIAIFTVVMVFDYFTGQVLMSFFVWTLKAEWSPINGCY